MSSRKIVVTGMGMLSAIGKNVEENFNALTQSKSGIGEIEFLDTLHRKDFPGGEIKWSNVELADFLDLPKIHYFTRAALLGAYAAKQALQQANLTTDFKQVGFINGTSVGGMDTTEKLYSKFKNKSENFPFIKAQHPGFTTNEIANYLGINGTVSTISTACSSGANAMMMGARLLKQNRLKQVVVGATDCLSKFTLNGFHSLRILSSELCKPFDEYRNGLNLGEAAAYLVIETEEEAQRRGQPILAYLEGYANANDAYHQTASSATGEGSFLAMQNALQEAELLPKQIDYINAHGTATPNNDLSEGIAIQRLFDKIPPISSTKAFTGHTLAAAGAIEAVYSILGLQHQCVFPNLNFKEQMADLKFSPQTTFKEQKVEYVLSNSFGFGGNCSSLIFSKA
ncbi:beta-ketoacyl-[acyl-carrier-protein] synthase family protein [Mesonia ostreae]|uniref:Beta-ketoacyl-[acyl-carrier-protein] synthase family protein n=1 Tax=Mesonia ostreae TaxID=861110 RepID=A0ABU2KI75_9FLAO|nr:beta-ketoacyl-[acyl-carrier-protein] synthase family protein [Mesonia ostreae]MDT0294379.1 beta-ketoacyl-[acyl-carrier-protein] synthase family protein [Mesonia ostreae]